MYPLSTQASTRLNHQAGPFRRLTLLQTGGKCARCGSTVNVQAHHLLPISEGGDKHGPGVPLCREHHRLAHRRDKLQDAF
jgi:5-methylcytosine-specific restriction endonuclease McrA